MNCFTDCDIGVSLRPNRIAHAPMFCAIADATSKFFCAASIACRHLYCRIRQTYHAYIARVSGIFLNYAHTHGRAAMRGYSAVLTCSTRLLNRGPSCGCRSLRSGYCVHRVPKTCDFIIMSRPLVSRLTSVAVEKRGYTYGPGRRRLTRQVSRVVARRCRFMREVRETSLRLAPHPGLQMCALAHRGAMMIQLPADRLPAIRRI